MKAPASVLIIDSNRGSLALMAKKLRKSGIDVTRVLRKDYSGKLLETRPSVILLDGSLAGTAQKVRYSDSLMPPPVLLLYSSPPGDGYGQDLLRDADDFMVHPFSEKEVIARINALRKKRRRIMTGSAIQGVYDAFNRITETTRSGSDDLAVLRIASREVERMIPGVRCTIIILGENRARASALDFEGKEGMLSIPLELRKYPEIRRVIETRKHLNIHDVARHPLLKEVRKLIKGKPLFSFLLIPIFFQEEMIGLFFLRSIESKREFFDIEISFMKMMAVTTATALRNVRLHRSIQEQLVKERTARAEARAKGKITRRLEKLFEHTADGLLIVNSRGMVTDVNTNFTRLTGYGKGEAVGMKVDRVLLPMEKNQNPLSTLLKGKARTALINYELMRKEGSNRYMAAHVEPLPGRKREFLISLHDLTEKHQMDLVVQRTKDFLESVIQHSMDAIIAADMKGFILVFNKAAEKITGYKSEEVIGRKNIVELYSPGGAKDIMRKLRSSHYGGVGRLETCASNLINRDSEEIPINVSAAVIYNENGEEVASVGVFQDLRERLKVEKQLRQAQERLLESQRQEAVSALAGAAAHELNQPLTSILGYAELLQRVERSFARGEEDETTYSVLRNAANIINQEAERMAEVVRKLGEITEYETKEYFDGVRIMDLNRGGIKEDASAKLEFWENLFKSASYGMITVGEDTVITRANPAAELILGQNPVGRPITRYLHESQYSAAIENFYNLVRGSDMQGEAKIKRADGMPARLYLQATKVQGQKEIVMMFRDLGAERKADSIELKLPEQPETRRDEGAGKQIETLRQICECVCRGDDWEGTLLKILGLLRGEIWFDSAGVFFPEAENQVTILSRDKDENSLQKITLHLREDLWRYSQTFFKEGPLIYDDIQQLDMTGDSDEIKKTVSEIKARAMRSVVIVPLYLQGSTLGGMYLASRDEGHFQSADTPFLEQVAGQIAASLASSQLNVFKNKILHSEKLALVGQMAAGIAHELNNPLAAISASAEMILAEESQGDDGRGVKRAERILECTRRIQNMIGNLMGFARPSPDEFIEMDVFELIEKALVFSSCEFQQDKVTIENRIPVGLKPITGVPDQLQQVFINLISNAAHACEGKEQPTIEISARIMENGYMEISVEDNGIGIEAVDFQNIFEPFFTSKADRGGTGLGLSIVKDIVNRHGGVIQVESKPSEGSIFRVILPLRREGQS